MLSIASGSSGNATYIGDESTGVLIDCGASTKRIMRTMDEALPNAEIQAVFVTHEHSDHIGSAAILERKLKERYGRNIPFYMSRGTYFGALENKPQCLPQNIHYVVDGDTIEVGQYLVEGFWVPHDVVEPMAFRVTDGDARAAVVTDLGHCPMSVLNKLRGVSLLSFEFNHDIDMLNRSSRYPQRTKERIWGPYGHLSNEQACEALSRIASPTLEHVVIAHISENNNTPELALHAAEQALAAHSWSNDIKLHLGQHRRALPLLRVSSFDSASSATA